MFVRAAGHPVRWRLMAELARGDLRVRELVGRVGERQNLVSYHLRLLRDGGLVTSRRSTFDARDSYYHLDLDRCATALGEAGSALHAALRTVPSPPTRPAGRTVRPRVLFICTGNSARSPIAEALLRSICGEHVEVVSAGSHPRDRIHPTVVRVLREEYDLDVTTRRPRHLEAFAGQRFDVVVTLCDRAREVCPEFGDAARQVHWSLPDPAGGDDATFVASARAIATRVRHLVPTLDITTQEVTS